MYLFFINLYTEEKNWSSERGMTELSAFWREKTEFLDLENWIWFVRTHSVVSRRINSTNLFFFRMQYLNDMSHVTCTNDFDLEIIVTRRGFYPKQHCVVRTGNETQSHSVPLHFRSTVRREGVRDNPPSCSKLVGNRLCEGRTFNAIKISSFSFFSRCLCNFHTTQTHACPRDSHQP